MKAVQLGVLAAVLFLVGCNAPAPTDTTPPATKSADGTDSSKPLSEAELGLKFYPGARLVTSGQAGGAVSANLETSDSVENATAFYEKELGTKADRKPGLTAVEGTKGSYKYAVAITATQGTTSISIMGAKQ